MHDLPFFIFRNVLVGVLLFAITWVMARKDNWRSKAGAAVIAWFLLAFLETVYWGLGQIDYAYLRPASPWLVPAHMIFAGLWLVVAAASASRRIRSKVGRVAAVALCLLFVAGGIIAFQWPREAQMTHDCEEHLHNQWLALCWYAEDHAGRLPPLPGTSWARETSPYYTYRPDLLKCPADRGNCVTSYLLTSQAAGKAFDKLGHRVILLLENKPRHRGKAHALLVDREVIEVSAGSAITPR